MKKILIIQIMLVILVLISINSVNATYVSENETIMGISDDNKSNLDYLI